MQRDAIVESIWEPWIYSEGEFSPFRYAEIILPMTFVNYQLGQFLYLMALSSQDETS